MWVSSWLREVYLRRHHLIFVISVQERVQQKGCSRLCILRRSQINQHAKSPCTTLGNVTVRASLPRHSALTCILPAAVTTNTPLCIHPALYLALFSSQIFTYPHHPQHSIVLTDIAKMASPRKERSRRCLPPADARQSRFAQPPPISSRSTTQSCLLA